MLNSHLPSLPCYSAAILTVRKGSSASIAGNRSSCNSPYRYTVARVPGVRRAPSAWGRNVAIEIDTDAGAPASTLLATNLER